MGGEAESPCPSPGVGRGCACPRGAGPGSFCQGHRSPRDRGERNTKSLSPLTAASRTPSGSGRRPSPPKQPAPQNSPWPRLRSGVGSGSRVGSGAPGSQLLPSGAAHGSRRCGSSARVREPCRDMACPGDTQGRSSRPARRVQRQNWRGGHCWAAEGNFRWEPAVRNRFG